MPDLLHALALACFVATSVRILRQRAIESWRQVSWWAASGAIAAGLAIRVLVTGATP
jgi:hypothetical protein